MTEEIQLVLIGGLISLVSTIGISIVTVFLNHWLEGKKEERRLRSELLQAMGRNVVYVGAMDNLDAVAKGKLLEIVKTIGDRSKTADDVALDLGFINAMAEEMKKDLEEIKKAA